MKRRILSIITALALCLSLCPTWAFATEADPSLCKHHPAHTAECGYAAPTEGHDCGHQHTAECYTKGVLPDADSGDPYEVGADTENLLDCHHSHNSGCGYVQADPGAPCGYVCRICPIEDLIAALPEQVTEDNADDVRGQLDHILDLYRELNEDEQGQLDLSRVTALQGALDAANAPVQAAETINVTNATNVTLTAEDGGCQGHTFTGTAQMATIYVESGAHNVTFSGLTISGSAKVGIAPGAAMNLTIEGTNTIQADYNLAGIYVPVGATLIINGTGSLNVSGNNSAGIGGATYAPDESGSDGDPNCGTVEINGGTVTATGGSTAAGIGGGIDTEGNPGNGGKVTINGGTVTATGGSDSYYGGAGIGGSAGETASDPAGNGGTLTINRGTVNLTAGTHKPQYPAYGFGQGSGSAPGGTCELTLADASYLTVDSLDPNGKYTITGDPTADMIVVPEGLVYTGQALDVSGIKIDDTKTGTGTYFNQTFTVKASKDGWNYTISPAEVKEAGNYTLTFSKEGHTSISKTFTVAKSGTQFVGDGEVKTYKDGAECSDFTAGDTITVKATPTPTGEAPTNSAMFAASFTPPTTGQMAVFVSDTQVSAPVGVGADGTYTMEVSAADVLLAAGGPGTEITLTARFTANDNMADGAGTVKVNITAVAKAEKGGTVIGYYGESGLVAALANSGNEGAVFTLLADVERTTALTIKVNCILDLNGKTIRSTGATLVGTALGISNGATVTIRGAGTVLSEHGHGLSVGGTATLEGGTFISSSEDCSGIYVQGKLIVTGENVIMRNTGNGNGLSVNSASGATAQLSGGTYEGGAAAIEIYGGTGTLAGLLNQKGASRVAYYKDNTTLVTEGLGGQTLSSGSYTVRACTHAYQYTHTTGATTHNQTCPACGDAKASEKCDFSNGPCPCGAVLAVTLPADLNLTYNGTAQKPGVTVTVDGTSLTEGYSVAYNNNISAGNAAAVTVTGKTFTGTTTLNFSIDRATPTITWSSTTQELTYTGQQAAITAPTVTLVNNESFGGTVHYSYTGTTSGAGLPTNAGTYTIKAHVDAEGNYNAADSTNELTLTIKQARVTITWGSSSQSVDYSGKPAEITAPTITAEGGVAVSVTPTYSYHQEGGEAGYRDGLPTNAGTYSIVASIKESGNLTAAQADMMLTINKAPLTITGAAVASKPYDGTDTATVTGVTFTGLVNGETLALGTDYTASGTFADANAGENKSVTVTVTLTSDKANNYTLASGGKFTATGTINRASSTITTAPTATGITYGEALSDSALTGGVAVSGDTTIAGAWSWTAPDTKPNAGTAQYEVTFTPTDTNYDTATVNVSVTVAKTTPTLTAPTASAIEYGQKLSDSTLTGGTATNPNGSAAVAGSWSWANGNTQPTATGTFPVAFVPSDTANYNTPGNVDASVTVNPAAPKITLTVPAYQVAGGEVKVTYQVENPHDAAFKEGIPETVTLTYKVGDGTEQTLTGTSFTIPAETAKDTVITVTANTAAVDGKYTAATKTATVTVTDKIPVEISGVGVTGRAYNGKAIDHTGTPVIKTLDGKTVTDATVTYTWSSGGDTGPINAGNYTLTITVNDGKYIGSTTVDFTIEKATVTITAVNKSAVVGSAQPELTYTVSGLADGETLATVPTLTCTPDMNTVGSYPITASGAAVPNTGNYNTTITYVDGALSVTAKPSTGGGGYVPSDPGGSSLPVTTTGQGSTTTTTTTTAAPTASVNNGTATTTINTAMGNEIVRQATANKSENVVIAPSVTGNVTKAEVSIPASTVGQIGSQTNASLTVSTPVADVTIPNGGLGSLSSAGGTVTVTAEQVGSSVELTVTAGGRTIQNVPGGVTLTVPAANTTPGTVAVLVHPDSTREVVRKSVADNGAVTIPLDGSAKLEIVDNSRQFADVPATSWAADAVAFASAHELFGGTGANQFSPDLPMSRGMLAVVLHNLESNPAQALTGAFADVDNSQWYAEGVAWAEAQGIIGGYGNGQFGPNDNITREQLAVILWRYAGSPAATDREVHFADAHMASGWAVDALRWATENGIINGKGGGILDPTGQATRAEAAQMLKNFMEDR